MLLIPSLLALGILSLWILAVLALRPSRLRVLVRCIPILVLTVILLPRVLSAPAPAPVPIPVLVPLILFRILLVILLIRTLHLRVGVRMRGRLLNIQRKGPAHRVEHLGVLVVVADRHPPRVHLLRRQGLLHVPPERRDVGGRLAAALAALAARAGSTRRRRGHVGRIRGRRGPRGPRVGGRRDSELVDVDGGRVSYAACLFPGAAATAAAAGSMLAATMAADARAA